MYGKKLLSVAALLFTFSNVSKVRAGSATIGLCSEDFKNTQCEAGLTADKLCINGENIYSYLSNTCYVKSTTLSSGINVLSVGDTDVTLETKGSTFSEENKLAIYNCKDSACTQTYGYIFDGTDYYEVSYNGESKKVGDYDNLEAPNNCSGKVGKLIKSSDKNIYLCLTADKSVQVNVNDDDEETYLMDNVANNIFTNAESITYPNIAILNAKKALIFNNVYTDDEYCVHESNLMMGRLDSFCDDESILNNLYGCEAGLCKVIYSSVGNGSYIVGSTLYECTIKESNPVSCAKDNDTEGLIIVEEQSDNYGTFYKVITTASMGDSTDLGKIRIYDCVKGKCTVTDGMIQYDSSSRTGYCTSAGDCSNSSLTLTLTIGTLNYDSTKKQFKYTTPGEPSSDILIDSGVKYFYTNENKHIIIHTNSNKDVIGFTQNATPGNYIVKDNAIIQECEEGAHKYSVESSDAVTDGGDCTSAAATGCTAVDATNTGKCAKGYYVALTEFGNSGVLAKSGKLYYCNQGECKELTDKTTPELGVGYYKNGAGNDDSYISCVEGGTCTVVDVNETTAANCNDIDAGKLYKDSDDSDIKLCIEKKAQDGIPLKTTGVQYVIDGTVFSGKTGAAVKRDDTDAKYVIIDFDGVNVIKNVKDTIPYRYTDPATSKVMSRSNNNEICKNKESIPEYKKDKVGNTYTLTK